MSGFTVRSIISCCVERGWGNLCQCQSTSFKSKKKTVFAANRNNFELKYLLSLLYMPDIFRNRKKINRRGKDRENYARVHTGAVPGISFRAN